MYHEKSVKTVTQKNSEIDHLKKETEKLNNTRLLTLAISIPSMLYIGTGRKPPKLLRVAALMTGTYTLLASLDTRKKDA